MKIRAGNAQHIGDRQEQQDSFGFSDPRNETFVSHAGFLGVVADGMGGLSHGSEASHAAVRTFLVTYESKAPGESIPEALARSLLAANEAVLALADRLDSRNGTGTTLVAAVVHGDSLHWISAGDSRIYLCNGNSLTRITSDHVYSRLLDEEVAKGKISRAEAEENTERAALTSFLGDLKEVDRNLRPFALRKDDRIFLCSDGLYRALTEAEITEAFRGDPQTACDTLVERAVAKQRKHQDNLTIIALSNGGDPADAHSTLNRTLLVLALLLILATIGGGGLYALWSRNPYASKAPAPAANGNPPAAPTAPPSPPATVSTSTAQSSSRSTGQSAGAATRPGGSASAHAGTKSQKSAGSQAGNTRKSSSSAGSTAAAPSTAAGGAVSPAGGGEGNQGQGAQSQTAQPKTNQGQTSQPPSGAADAAQSAGLQKGAQGTSPDVKSPAGSASSSPTEEPTSPAQSPPPPKAESAGQPAPGEPATGTPPKSPCFGLGLKG